MKEKIDWLALLRYLRVNQWTSTHGLNHDVDFEFVDNEKNGLIVCLIRRQWIGPLAFLDKNGNPEESSARCTH